MRMRSSGFGNSWPGRARSRGPRPRGGVMILVVDNYDSFTWNLVHYLKELGAAVEVVRSDALTAAEAMASGAEAFLISPGPGTPDEAGISLELVGLCADGRRRRLGVGRRGHRRVGKACVGTC